MEVGIRELKSRLSRYLAAVGQGDEILVTDRGRPVAKISPIGTERTIDRLIAEGVVTPGAGTTRSYNGPLVRAKSPVSPLVAEQRR